MAVIVVLDDSALQNALLERTLRCTGHVAESATTLAAAGRLCRQLRPALVLVELLLRQANGFSQACFLERAFGAVPVLMTSRGQAAEHRWARARGIAFTLQRPAEAAAIQAAVDTILRRIAATTS